MYLTKDEKEDLYKSVKKKHKITGDKEAEEFFSRRILEICAVW
jgi:hypothetical protein